MPYFVGILFLWQMTLDIFTIDVGLAPGLSLKNLLMYLGLAIVVVRATLSGGLRLELRSLHVTYLLLVAYAVLTWGVASYVIRYENYEAIENGLLIKSTLLDYYVMFLVCFYCVRTPTETALAMRLISVASILPQLLTLSEVAGLTNLGVSPIRDDGRVDGALGEANMYAAYIAFFLPTYLARAISEKGLWRVVWIGGLLTAMTVMLMTVSRGGFIGLGVGSIIAAIIFRRQLPLAKLSMLAVGGVVLSVLILFAVSGEFRSLITDRLFAESGQADIGTATNGRADFWINALRMMATKPITFITGFGWRTYWSMPFTNSPHNSYLNYWFNLGLPGLLGLIYPFALVIKTAVRAAQRDSTNLRYLLIAFVFGMSSMCMAIFFVELYFPWFYIWAYIGVSMRAALLSMESPVVAAEPQRYTRSQSDPYGWRAPASKPPLGMAG
jgi:hypothetical protein